MFNGGPRPKLHPGDSRKSVNGAIDTWKATIDGGCVWERTSVSVWVCESECVSERVSGDLWEQIHQMWRATRAAHICVCAGHDLGKNLIFPGPALIQHMPSRSRGDALCLNPSFKTNSILTKSVSRRNTREAFAADHTHWSPAAPNRGTKSDKNPVGKNRNFADRAVKTCLTDKDLRAVGCREMGGGRLLPAKQRKWKNTASAQSSLVMKLW